MRVSRDIRLIVHRSESSLLLCYVDHHDKAYAWAERRRLEMHPRTGAAQFVEVRESVQEIVVPRYVSAPDEEAATSPSSPTKLFVGIAEETLLGYGVPEEWLADVRDATEDSLLDLASHLPDEASEALLQLATGGTPEPQGEAATDVDPFEHPDAQRRFRVMSDVDELERALEYPWEKWAIFLHPAQRQWVEKDYNGPARISGSAGTGKTIVALHRAVHLASRNLDARVLLTTFSEGLADALRARLRLLISNRPRLGERIDVEAIDDVGERLYRALLGPIRVAGADDLSAALDATGDLPKSRRFFQREWEDIVDAFQLADWDAYRSVKRLGRKTQLPESQRERLWKVFRSVQESLNAKGLTTRAAMFTKLADHFQHGKDGPYDHVVVDEAQDITPAQLRFVGALTGSKPNGLFFSGDLGQRIFQQAFSWRSMGVDIRGRSRSLRINYRTSHQIRSRADRLLGSEIADVDGNQESRRGTVSVFNGPHPEIVIETDEEAEIHVVGDWLRARAGEGVRPNEMAVFVRSESQLERAKHAIEAADLPLRVPDSLEQPSDPVVTVGTMHLAKGLEFRAVVVMACDDEVLPLQERIESIGDEADLEEVYNSERNLLYVACTRARDRLLLSATDPESEFLADMA